MIEEIKILRRGLENIAFSTKKSKDWQWPWQYITHARDILEEADKIKSGPSDKEKRKAIHQIRTAHHFIEKHADELAGKMGRKAVIISLRLKDALFTCLESWGIK